MCFSPTAYTLPVAISTPTKGAKSQAGPPPSISARLSLNLSYFLTNYILLSLLALLIISLTHPLMLLYTFLVGGLWYGHSLTLTKNYKLVIANKDVFGDILTPKRRTYICTIVTLFVFIFYALLPLVTVLSVSAAITFAHAALRGEEQTTKLLPTTKLRLTPAELSEPAPPPTCPSAIRPNPDAGPGMRARRGRFVLHTCL